MNIITALRNSEMTHGLSDAELEALSHLFRCRHVKRDEIIFREGEPSEELYLIAKGRVSVLIYSVSLPGKSEKIASLRDNELFGEFSFIDGSPRSATIMAEEETDLIFVDNVALYRYLDENEHVGYIVMRNIAKILTGKLRRTNLEMRNATL
ncbi:MAG TPA: cyclic nucleotide-binding domain-containing protein [Candidatus Marinimicrobia bacterium]|nr:cyclic nucleotide-binding domain-containing protein [Candidatus Neomarinimicrobiota bacterium]HRS51153.1 cyclic nucleotide-binding domain-containing protein [Candidatus Neomarinimicrobiota bacterium]HRU91608.1 cyclic nucleotide-binding domain-containing protein [Candidatus Neomarinimicrobiota bacterium]